LNLMFASSKAIIRNGWINLHLEQNQEILSRHIASCLPYRREFWMFKCLYASSRFPVVFPSTQVELQSQASQSSSLPSVPWENV
jgi:hypothetical protein